jgi:hypothetical protein
MVVERSRLETLSQIYDLYDDFSKGLTVACKRGCATCCTQDVTMTTLEGYRILQYLISAGQQDLLQVVHATTHSKGFRPALSTNEFAACCLRGEDPAEEEQNPCPVACHFLLHNECLIYQERPFGCRCFFSAQPCESMARAVVDPFLVTVNTVFLQFIEHIDTGGLFGNMNDVLIFLELEGKRKHYEARTTFGRPSGLVRNRAIPALLVPPENEQGLQPILEELRKIGNRRVRF